MDNPWVISIVGGLIASILGGLVLAVAGRLRCGGPAQAAMTIVKLALFALETTIITAVVFALPPPHTFDFGVEGLDLIVRLLLVVIGGGAFFLQIFFGINIFRRK